jgi:hypothetical protein
MIGPIKKKIIDMIKDNNIWKKEYQNSDIPNEMKNSDELIFDYIYLYPPSPEGYNEKTFYKNGMKLYNNERNNDRVKYPLIIKIKIDCEKSKEFSFELKRNYPSSKIPFERDNYYNTYEDAINKIIEYDSLKNEHLTIIHNNEIIKDRKQLLPYDKFTNPIIFFFQPSKKKNVKKYVYFVGPDDCYYLPYNENITLTDEDIKNKLFLCKREEIEKHSNNIFISKFKECNNDDIEEYCKDEMKNEIIFSMIEKKYKFKLNVIQINHSGDKANDCIFFTIECKCDEKLSDFKKKISEQNLCKFPKWKLCCGELPSNLKYLIDDNLQMVHFYLNRFFVIYLQEIVENEISYCITLTGFPDYVKINLGWTLTGWVYSELTSKWLNSIKKFISSMTGINKERTRFSISNKLIDNKDFKLKPKNTEITYFIDCELLEDPDGCEITKEDLSSSLLPSSSSSSKLYHYKCYKCKNLINDNSKRYFLNYIPTSISKVYCENCFKKIDFITSYHENYFFDKSVPSHYSCSNCHTDISDADSRYHYCLSDEGDINLCCKCYKDFLSNKTKTITNNTNDFRHSSHFKRYSQDYLFCKKSYRYEEEPTDYWRGLTNENEKNKKNEKFKYNLEIDIEIHFENIRIQHKYSYNTIINEIIKDTLLKEKKNPIDYYALDFETTTYLNEKHTLSECGFGKYKYQILIIPKLTKQSFIVYFRLRSDWENQNISPSSYLKHLSRDYIYSDSFSFDSLPVKFEEIKMYIKQKIIEDKKLQEEYEKLLLPEELSDPTQLLAENICFYQHGICSDNIYSGINDFKSLISSSSYPLLFEVVIGYDNSEVNKYKIYRENGDTLLYPYNDNTTYKEIIKFVLENDEANSSELIVVHKDEIIKNTNKLVSGYVFPYKLKPFDLEISFFSLKQITLSPLMNVFIISVSESEKIFHIQCNSDDTIFILNQNIPKEFQIDPSEQIILQRNKNKTLTFHFNDYDIINDKISSTLKLRTFKNENEYIVLRQIKKKKYLI